MKNRLITIIAVIFLTVTVAACDARDDERGKGDAPIANKNGDDSPAVVVNFPNDFANIAFKCLDGTGLYVTTREAAPVVVANDPGCSGSIEGGN